MTKGKKVRENARAPRGFGPTRKQPEKSQEICFVTGRRTLCRVRAKRRGARSGWRPAAREIVGRAGRGCSGTHGGGSGTTSLFGQRRGLRPAAPRARATCLAVWNNGGGASGVTISAAAESLLSSRDRGREVSWLGGSPTRRAGVDLERRLKIRYRPCTFAAGFSPPGRGVGGAVAGA